MGSLPLSQVINDRTPEFSRVVVKVVVNLWNFQAFDFTKYAGDPTQITASMIGMMLGYTAFILAGILGLSALVFQNKDMN